MSEYRLICGDALQVLQTLPSESVHMVCTSPPYFGLRDYSTATWEGGDPDCDHLAPPRGGRGSSTLTSGGSSAPQERYIVKLDTAQYRDVCGKCGARRVDLQIGLEDTPDAYVARLVEVFREVRRVLHKTGTVWINLGDSYNGSGGAGGDYAAGGLKDGQPKYPGRNVNGLGPKQLLGIPWRVAFALQADGWVLRSEIIWAKKAPMPESVQDRPTKAHEQVFLLAKSASYYYDATAIAEESITKLDSKTLARGSQGYASASAGPNGSAQRGNINGYGYSGEGKRNRRSVWTLGPEPSGIQHFAVMPTKLVEPCILAGSSAHGCCSQCLAPWQRVTEVERPVPAAIRPKDPRTHLGHSSKSTINQSNWHDDRTPSRTITTLGWQPTCDCQVPAPGGSRVLVTPDPVPCTVLDPFSGAGTVGVVALKHHRHYIGIDLNESYNELARRRIEQVQPTLLEVT